MLATLVCVVIRLTAVRPNDSSSTAPSTTSNLQNHAPRYSRAALRRAIVHIGVGAFHRAHLATYIHELCKAGEMGWSITGVGLLPGDRAVADALRSQDHLYTLVVRGAAETEVEVIGSIVDYIFAVEEWDDVVDAIADPDTQIVSLTITEGGYPIDDVTGEYNPASPMANDRSAFAAIAAGLARRRTSTGAPLTVLSCDNILSNGRAAKTSTLGAAADLDDELGDWIEQNVTFPNSMVDRITPATVDSDREWLADDAGLVDAWPVVTEPFIQWVVEDDFAGDRLPFEELDVIVTDDVEPYEHMKLRLLNAGHSCVAYLAALEGISSVDSAMAAPHLRSFLENFLAVEAQPMVPAVPGIDLDEYVASLIERFSNPSIGDQIARLCLDGSVKFTKFLLPTIRAQLAVDGPIDSAALAIAGWCEYLLGKDEQGELIVIADDPNVDLAIRHAEASRTDPVAFLDFAEVFDTDLRNDDRFRETFATALGTLRSTGVRAATQSLTR